MLFVREFEIYPGEEYLIVEPCDMGGGTFGDDLQDAIDSAADWLYGQVLGQLLIDQLIEGGKLGHEPKHGGRIITVAVDCNLSRVDAVTAADAARILGVSPARISQMCDNYQLLSWKEGSKRMITRDSVNARLAEKPRPGRPRKHPVEQAVEAAV